MKETLLDLDRTPTMEELKKFFHEHDFTTARLYKPNELKGDDAAAVKEISNVVKQQWDELAQGKGQKSGAMNYSAEDSPLMQLRGNVSRLVGEGVFKLVDEHPEMIPEILAQFPDELQDPSKADALLQASVDKMMDVADFEAIAAILNENPAGEDFSNIPNNHRAQDFERKWNHTRAKIKVDSLDDDAMEGTSDPTANVESEALSNIALHEFWDGLSDEDKKLLQYSMAGMAQQKIADKMGFKTHSAVTKRLAKIREKFLK